MNISKESQARMEAVRKKQSDNAHCLGVLVWEFQDKWAEMKLSGDFLRLGAARYEYESRLGFFMDTIHKTMVEQRAVGEAALAALGIDFFEAEYTIDSDGLVLRLESDGHWRPA